MPSLTPEEQKKFQLLIEEKSGIQVPFEKAYLIETRLERMVADYNCDSYGQLYNKAVAEGTQGEILTKLLDQMTTNETLWFRDGSPFEAFNEKLLPELFDIANKTGRKIRIWCAACSTGQEPYTLSLLINEFGRKKGLTNLIKGKFEIVATDLCSSAIDQAKKGLYDPFSLSRGLTEEQKNLYFEPSGEGNKWVIKDYLKEIVTFQRFNLKDSYTSLGLFDVVFVRNVLIYFNDTFKKDIIERMSRQMHSTGYLFVGSTEIIANLTNTFKLQTHGRAAYYQLASTVDARAAQEQAQQQSSTPNNFAARI